jgi:hypothetical protein
VPSRRRRSVPCRSLKATRIPAQGEARGNRGPTPWVRGHPPIPRPARGGRNDTSSRWPKRPILRLGHHHEALVARPGHTPAPTDATRPPANAATHATIGGPLVAEGDPCLEYPVVLTVFSVFWLVINGTLILVWSRGQAGERFLGCAARSAPDDSHPSGVERRKRKRGGDRVSPDALRDPRLTTLTPPGCEQARAPDGSHPGWGGIE